MIRPATGGYRLATQAREACGLAHAKLELRATGITPLPSTASSAGAERKWGRMNLGFEIHPDPICVRLWRAPSQKPTRRPSNATSTIA